MEEANGRVASGESRREVAKSLELMTALWENDLSCKYLQKSRFIRWILRAHEVRVRTRHLDLSLISSTNLGDECTLNAS